MKPDEYILRLRGTKRCRRLYDFTKSQIITSDHVYCVFGKVNSADKLYLVLESVKIVLLRRGAR